MPYKRPSGCRQAFEIKNKIGKTQANRFFHIFLSTKPRTFHETFAFVLALRDNNQRPSLKGWGESNPFDDRAIAFIGMKEVVSGIQLNPEQKRRVLTETLFKK